VNKKKNNRIPREEKTKILIVDDHPIVRDGLTMLVHCETDLTVIASAGNMTSAIMAVKNQLIDLAIIDMLLKDTTGIQVTQKIKALCPYVIVLIFSMSDKILHIQQAFKAGARGYILKDEVYEKIIFAIRQVLKGETYLSKRLSKMFTKHQLSKLLPGDGSYPANS